MPKQAVTGTSGGSKKLPGKTAAIPTKPINLIRNKLKRSQAWQQEKAQKKREKKKRREDREKEAAKLGDEVSRKHNLLLTLTEGSSKTNTENNRQYASL